ncbi:MAG TPA: pyridoxamine 5'-phosphate oxidase family protein [Pelomicrobium sp.]|nr:pyridoxamine 5'-phosphate oxidase family protein [Pelomicrobium sp.]
MTHRFAEITFTDGVKAVQERYRSRAQNERLLAQGGPRDALGPAEVEFIAARDSFYIATVGETGWPYVQHRGGPAGFVKVLGPKTIAYADFRGNTQLISAGNAAGNDRVSLILMDYANRRRLKILGRIRFEDASRAAEDVRTVVELPGYRARVERVALIEVEAFDWNCPQHITPRYTEAEVRAAVAPLHERIVELEARLAAAVATGAEPAADRAS